MSCLAKKIHESNEKIFRLQIASLIELEYLAKHGSPTLTTPSKALKPMPLGYVREKAIHAISFRASKPVI